MTVTPETIAFAHRLADAAGEVIRPYFRQRIDVTDKRADDQGQPVFDPVTEADKGAEKRHPRHHRARAAATTESSARNIGEKPGTNGLRWVLDPVDGTRAFINGRHEWGSLIALEEDGRPVLGIIDQPCARRALHRRQRRRPRCSLARRREPLCACAMCVELADAILCATHP